MSIRYIKDNDVDVSTSVLKLADDSTLHSNVCTCDLDEMSEWSTKWQILFNACMCSTVDLV